MADNQSEIERLREENRRLRKVLSMARHSLDCWAYHRAEKRGWTNKECRAAGAREVEFIDSEFPDLSNSC